MSLKKILFYALGIGLVIYLVQQIILFLSGENLFNRDLSLDANPSPPAKKEWYAEA